MAGRSDKSTAKPKAGDKPKAIAGVSPSRKQANAFKVSAPKNSASTVHKNDVARKVARLGVRSPTRDRKENNYNTATRSKGVNKTKVTPSTTDVSTRPKQEVGRKSSGDRNQSAIKTLKTTFANGVAAIFVTGASFFPVFAARNSPSLHEQPKESRQVVKPVVQAGNRIKQIKEYQENFLDVAKGLTERPLSESSPPPERRRKRTTGKV